jgi:ATP-dependent Lhr-like helicase
MGETAELTFLARGTIPHVPAPNLDGVELPVPAIQVLDVLRTRGAVFADDVAAQAKLSATTVRGILWSLVRLGLATNDRYDLVRRGEPHWDPPPIQSRGQLRAFLRDSRRRHDNHPPEGRWSLLPWGQPDAESAAFCQARLLLERYGIVARELALLSGTPTPWRILYEIYSRLELAGDVRRGYFVEGLSGAQFALADAARQLQELTAPSQADAPVLLVSSQDPANLYGSGAPLNVPSPEAEPRPFLRRAGNWLVVKAGRPILVIEQQGRRLTALSSVDTDLAQATARLPDLLKLMPNGDLRHKLSVETWNEQPVISSGGRDFLERAGFVRDYQAMTLYAVWQ